MTATSQQTLDRLEREAEQARARVSSQLAQVRHRLEPDEIKHQALEAKDRLMKRARATASQYIEDRKRRLKQTVLDAAMNNPAPMLAVGTLVAWSLWNRLSRIPAPILLIGAGGLAGLMRWNDGASRSARRSYAADHGSPQLERSRSEWERTGRGLTSVGEPASQAAERAREIASEVGTRISGGTARARSAVSDMAGRTAEVTGRAGSTVADMAGRTAEVTVRTGSAVSDMAERTAVGIGRAGGAAATIANAMGRRAGSQLSDLFERHPLVLGALGLALGAAIAYSLRPARTEARMVGEASDRFQRRAREMAEEQLEQARRHDERAYEAGWDEAREQSISAESGREAGAELGRKARAVANRAKEAAREERENAETTV
jgi:hypothetical protein